MRAHRFYQLAAWLPILVPLLCWAGIRTFGLPASTPVADLIGLLALSFVYGGVPYAGLALWTTRWLATAPPEAEVRRRLWWAPVVMLPVFWGCLPLTSQWFGDARGNWVVLGVLGTVCIPPLGYAYVAIIVALCGVARRVGVVEAPSAVVAS